MFVKKYLISGELNQDLNQYLPALEVSVLDKTYHAKK